MGFSLKKLSLLFSAASLAFSTSTKHLAHINTTAARLLSHPLSAEI
jgi:hypothetical protein